MSDIGQCTLRSFLHPVTIVTRYASMFPGFDIIFFFYCCVVHQCPPTHRVRRAIGPDQDDAARRRRASDGGELPALLHGRDQERAGSAARLQGLSFPSRRKQAPPQLTYHLVHFQEEVVLLCGLRMFVFDPPVSDQASYLDQGFHDPGWRLFTRRWHGHGIHLRHARFRGRELYAQA